MYGRGYPETEELIFFCLWVARAVLSVLSGRLDYKHC